MTGIGMEAGAQAARVRALAVLRIRSRALAVALLPAAAAVILLAGGSTGHLVGPGWDAARWAVSVVAVVVLVAAGVIALVVARSRPAVSPTVPISEEAAPDLYRLVRDLADRLDVPAPSAVALTPDCDSWLEDRTHRAHGPPPPEGRDEVAAGRHPHRRTPAAPVLVIGSPFLWWMRVGELRAVLAPVVAGTGPSAHPDIAAARRFVRGLDAAVAVASTQGRCPLFRSGCAGIGWVARLLLRSCRGHAAEMERGVAAAAAERAQAVDYGLRIVAQEQVGLAYAGWDRLLTRVALPAWRMGRWPSRLDAGVVAALTELSRRDRLAEGFASRLGERPACDLLEEPGAIDEAASLLAARLFHGGPAETGPDWSPVDWQEYPEEVVDRKWRTDAARLHRVLDNLGVRRCDPTPTTPQHSPSDTSDTSDTEGPTLSRVLDHLTGPPPPATPTEPQDEPPAPTEPTASAERHGAPTAPTELHSEPATSTEPPGEHAVSAGSYGESAPSVEGQGTPDASAERQGEPAVSAEFHGDPDVPDPHREPAAPTKPHGEPAAPTGLRREATEPHRSTAPTGLPGESTVPTGLPSDPAASAESHGAPATSAEPRSESAELHSDPGLSAAPAPTTTPTPAPTTPAPTEDLEPAPTEDLEDDDPPPPNPRSVALAARLTAEIAREEAASAPQGSAAAPAPGQGSPETALWDDGMLPLFPLQPPRTPRELLADHVTAMVCCAAMDTAGATPGLDWLDGPSLLVNGERTTDLAPRVLSLIEDGDPTPLRAWMVERGIRPEKPVRLV
ncbi:hypothetical protein ACGFNV_33740 [Streptomyces sp. NPDC048751]|uniref:hypothetical protein n=1 Tax=Streptomyces sp. NPDC048751 TaxID=3365591 RepID=UPI00372371D9